MGAGPSDLMPRPDNRNGTSRGGSIRGKMHGRTTASQTPSQARGLANQRPAPRPSATSDPITVDDGDSDEGEGSEGAAKVPAKTFARTSTAAESKKRKSPSPSPEEPESKRPAKSIKAGRASQAGQQRASPNAAAADNSVNVGDSSEEEEEEIVFDGERERQRPRLEQQRKAFDLTGGDGGVKSSAKGKAPERQQGEISRFAVKMGAAANDRTLSRIERGKSGRDSEENDEFRDSEPAELVLSHLRIAETLDVAPHEGGGKINIPPVMRIHKNNHRLGFGYQASWDPAKDWMINEGNVANAVIVSSQPVTEGTWLS